MHRLPLPKPAACAAPTAGFAAFVRTLGAGSAARLARALSLGAVALALAGLPALPLPGALAPAAAATGGWPSTTVDWQPGGSDAEIDAAFARARQRGLPVLLYWGASWCPPCNQLKATLFNRQDFGALGRGFVAVHVDGDRPGAQKIGARFRVSGYPSLLLLSAEGQELTRLPGEVDPPQVLEALRAALAGGRPAAAVLADARAGRPLSAADWRLLAFYSWDSGGAGALLPAAERGAALADLARRSAAQPDAELGTRLWLKALTADEASAERPWLDAALRQRVLAVWSDPARTRLHGDVLMGAPVELLQRLEGGAPGDRAALAVLLDAALLRLEQDATLSRGDRAWALVARLELAREGQPEDVLQPRLPAPLLNDTRALARRFDAEIRDAFERQAVITALAHALALSGQWDVAEALLKDNLARSPAPYYLMSQLGSQARRRGRTAEALDWYAQSWQRSVGPATRLQWGSGYLGALLELAPAEAPRIEAVAAQLFDEAGQDAAAFHERSATALGRAGRRLGHWAGEDGSRRAVLGRLRARLDPVCARLAAEDPQRPVCDALLRPASPNGG